MAEKTHTIREISPEDREALANVGPLHVQLLPFGPMARLGEAFVREVCYRVPMADGLLRLAVFEHEGRILGFVAYTHRSITFHRLALRRHWLYSGVMILAAVLRDPRRIPRLVRVGRVVRSRRAEKEMLRDPLGEVVCLAVVPEARSSEFARRVGVRVSEALVDYARVALARTGVDRMRMIVDADNRPVLMLYHCMGARLEPYKQGGKASMLVWFELPAVPAGGLS
jgi:ribosomal protein S18 acetylase RimI-like enzyme